ncbi:Fe-S cluster assembly ATPase SufC [Candidatus Woesebacteria bacterium]|nr:Fe-S cluster assembly ATPase SufC [Candidatus Woesebacteria bacterium]
MSELLEVSDLTGSIGGKSVLKNISFRLKSGSLLAIVGANGGGKSSLAQVLMGNPDYQIDRGRVLIDRQELQGLTVDERARLGLYVAWQNPISIPGVTVFSLCKAAYEANGHTIKKLVEFKKLLEELAVSVGLTTEHVARFVNDGFSGGEKKRLELLQLLLLKPKLVVLDEIDSGLDQDGRALIVKVVRELRDSGAGLIVISHYEQLISELKPDVVMEMANGQLQPRV